MNERTIHILLVEDEEAHAELVQRAFDRSSRADQFRLTLADSLQSARARLAESLPDLVITDWILPDGHGIELLPAGDEARKDHLFPAVVMTSHGDEQIAVEAIKAGALDYVVKSAQALAGMPRVAERALREWDLIVERRRAEEALQRKTRQQEQLIEVARHLAASLDVREVLTRIGVGAKEMLKAHGCAIYLLEKDGHSLTPVVAIEPPYEKEILSTVLDVETSFTGQAVKARRGLIFNEAGSDFSGQQIPGTPVAEEEHIIVTPFIADDKVLGAMCLNRREVYFTREDLSLAETFAAYAATILKNAQAHRDLQREVEERKRAEQGQRKALAEALLATRALQESRARYSALFTGITDGVIAHYITGDGLPGRIIEVNDVVCQMLGYSREELMGMSVGGIDAPESNVDVRRVMKELEAGQDVLFERTHATKDGRRIPVEIHAQTFEFEGQSAILSTVRDITERKRLTEERERLLAQIQEQARQVQQIVDTVPEGVLLLNGDGQIIMANPVAEENLAVLTGARVGDVLSSLGDRPLDEFLSAPPQGRWHEVAASDPPPRAFEVIARSVSEGDSGSGAAETAPAPGGWVLVIRDVTQQREFEQRIQQQERLAAVGQLAAGIAHDFNNVMATIVLYAQMTARTEGLPTRIKERMGTINRQAQHATRLIQQILDFSRRAILERRPFDLTPFLKEQVQLLKHTLPESIEIELAYGSDERAAPLIVHADPTRIQQAITNLALNARDAMPNGGELRIELGRIWIGEDETPPLAEMAAAGTAVEEWVRMVVSDTGTGIPPDVMPHIFEPFFTTKAPLGSGLGLAQVHGIVRQHEGYVGVDTQVRVDGGQSGGTTFTIYLPALPVHPPKARTDVLSKKVSLLVKGRGETILVVEDDKPTREALMEGLELLNYQVVGAANGQEALAILDRRGGDSAAPDAGSALEQKIALVLSDVLMPVMGGVALLHALQEQGSTVRVLLLTGHPLENELDSLQEQGVVSGLVGWALKPLSLKRLSQVVARALKQNLGTTDVVRVML